jgi:hypothetical protein
MNFFKFLLVILMLIYTVIPYDLLPDFIPVGGWIDDLFLLGLLIYYLRKGRLPGFLYGRGKQYGYEGRDGREQGGSERSRENRGQFESPSKNGHQIKEPHVVLGIEPGAGEEQIRAAYRRAAQAYHPDKVSHLGPELQELAQKKFVEVQEAYDKLMRKYR